MEGNLTEGPDYHLSCAHFQRTINGLGALFVSRNWFESSLLDCESARKGINFTSVSGSVFMCKCVSVLWLYLSVGPGCHLVDEREG